MINDDLDMPISAADKAVCDRCISDDALALYIKRKGALGACNYCNENRIVLSLQDVCEFMFGAFSSDYGSPECVGMIRSDGEWVGELYNTEDLLSQASYYPNVDYLYDDILDAFAEMDGGWASVEQQVLSHHQRMCFGWERFKECVKHKRRFTFWYEHPTDELELTHPDNQPFVGIMLDHMRTMIEAMSVFSTLNVSTEIWRAHAHNDSDLLELTAERFGSPPNSLAKYSNRMSPAGISMFYGAEDYETSCVEVAHYEKARVTAAVFRPVKPLVVLDLTSIPSAPSYFDVEKRQQRLSLEFLRHFANDLSRPILSQDSLIDYVPTQAFTEFVRFQLTARGGKQVDGIRYLSSKTSKACLVIFAENEQCGKLGRSQLLEFDPRSIRTSSAVFVAQIINS